MRDQIRESVNNIRTALESSGDEPNWANIYESLLSNAHAHPERHSCYRCKYHNPLLCAVVPRRNTANFFELNDCTDWQKKD